MGLSVLKECCLKKLYRVSPFMWMALLHRKCVLTSRRCDQHWQTDVHLSVSCCAVVASSVECRGAWQLCLHPLRMSPPCMYHQICIYSRVGDFGLGWGLGPPSNEVSSLSAIEFR